MLIGRPRTVDQNEIISRAGKPDPRNINHVAGDDQGIQGFESHPLHLF